MKSGVSPKTSSEKWPHPCLALNALLEAPHCPVQDTYLTVQCKTIPSHSSKRIRLSRKSSRSWCSSRVLSSACTSSTCQALDGRVALNYEIFVTPYFPRVPVPRRCCDGRIGRPKSGSVRAFGRWIVNQNSRHHIVGYTIV